MNSFKQLLSNKITTKTNASDPGRRKQKSKSVLVTEDLVPLRVDGLSASNDLLRNFPSRRGDIFGLCKSLSNEPDPSDNNKCPSRVSSNHDMVSSSD